MVSEDAHLQINTWQKQFVLLADAHLEVEGVRLPVHKAVLAAVSPVFADLFLASAPPNLEADGVDNKSCIPMSGHSLPEVQAALKFLYQRHGSVVADTPGQHLWTSFENARAVLQFAHKYNMKTILKECEPFLTSRAEEGSSRLFPNAAAAAAWAALAEQCGLSALLAHAELYMVKNAGSDFWQTSVPASHQLSHACLMRMLRASQLHMARCHSRIDETRRSHYSPRVPDHVDVPTLISWQSDSSSKAVPA